MSSATRIARSRSRTGSTAGRAARGSGGAGDAHVGARPARPERRQHGRAAATGGPAWSARAEIRRPARRAVFFAERREQHQRRAGESRIGTDRARQRRARPSRACAGPGSPRRTARAAPRRAASASSAAGPSPTLVTDSPQRRQLLLEDGAVGLRCRRRPARASGGPCPSTGGVAPAGCRPASSRRRQHREPEACCPDRARSRPRSRRPSARPGACRSPARGPVPPNSRVVEASAWEKGWNRRAATSGEMPMPVSVTSKRTSAESGRLLGRARTCTITSPRSVNLTALPTRFSRTWRSRPGSPADRAGTSGRPVAASSRPLACARSASSPTTSSTASRRSKSVTSSSSLPASILEKSRMSLMIASSASPRASDGLGVLALLGRRARCRAAGRSCR